MSPAHYPLGALLGRAHARYVAECEEGLRAAGFPDLAVAHGSNILRHLSPEGTIRVSELVRLSGISKQAVSQQLTYLSDHGFLIIEADGRDARAKVARLTPRGEESRRTIRQVFTEVEKSWSEQYGEERLRMLLDTLADVSGLQPEH